MIKKYMDRIYYKIAQINRLVFINKKNRKKLKNRNPITLLSSNCNGGMILHDLNLPFLTPTVNLFITANDFIKFIDNLDFYIKQKVVAVNQSEFVYPVGLLYDIKIYFQHYKSMEEAITTWEKRKKRIQPDHIFIMMTDRDGYTEETIKKFDELPYKNKVIFTHKKYEQYKSAFCISGFENEPCVGILSDYCNIWGKRHYDEFGYVEWLNGKQ